MKKGQKKFFVVTITVIEESPALFCVVLLTMRMKRMSYSNEKIYWQNKSFFKKYTAKNFSTEV